jgi:hypothetical protein
MHWMLAASAMVATRSPGRMPPVNRVVRHHGDRHLAADELQSLPKADWTTWRASLPDEVLAPGPEYGAASSPLKPSATSLAPGPVRELRDPAIFREGSHTDLLYSITGESAIAIAELRPPSPR